MKWALASAVPSLVFCVPGLAQQIIIVPDNAPDIAAAVGMANDGDVVQVRPSYFGVCPTGVIVNKSLTIEGAAGGIGRVAAPERLGGYGGAVLRVTSLGSRHRVLLRNLSIISMVQGLDPTHSTPLLSLELANESGVVVLDNVSVGGGSLGRTAVAATGMQGLEIMTRRCHFVGHSGNPPYLSGNEIGPPGGNAIELHGPLTAILEDCTLEGGEGGDAGFDDMAMRSASPGGAAMTVAGSSVALVGCMLIDGTGGYSYGDPGAPSPNPCQFQGPPGVSSLPADMFEVRYQPGAPGGATGCPAQQPPPSRSLGRPIDFTIPVTQQPLGQPFQLQVHSLPPTAGWSALLLGLGLHRIQLPGIQGALWLDPIFYWTLLPGPSSSGWATLPMAGLPAMLNIELDAKAQLVHVTWNFGIEVGAPRTMLFVPAGR